MKKIFYSLLYHYYYHFYRYKKIVLPLLEVWVGQSCTLCCRDCLHMIPYISPSLYDIDALIRDLEKMIEMSRIQYLSVVGGEPFTNRDIIKLVRFINECDEIPKAKIITNGTIIPDDECISEFKKKNKIEIHIDQYPANIKSSEKTYLTLSKNGVACTLYHYDVYEEMHWKYLGENHIKKQNLFQAIKSHQYCVMNRVFTLSEGIFVSCPRGITTKKVYYQKPLKYEYVKLNKIKDVADGRAKLAVCTCGIVKKYCQYCYGVTKNNYRNIQPGIQIEVKRNV